MYSANNNSFKLYSERNQPMFIRYCGYVWYFTVKRLGKLTGHSNADQNSERWNGHFPNEVLCHCTNPDGWTHFNLSVYP